MGFDWIPLPEPRRLTPAEQAVLDHLVAQANNAELSAQAAQVWATAVCDCGCSSILLRTDAPAISPETMLRFSAFGRDDWFAIDYSRWVPMLQVVVHVTQGSLHELEIFAGEGVPVDIPSPGELHPITIN
ncbi:MAG TPA: hypothetical protein VFC19_32140 [Candidatus Limnocylindrales bacterium]|nr:hypothetical protein [Candidatus Limnocylindrales bacterium]